MQTVGSVASVIAAIRDDGAAEVERIERDAAAELARMRSEAESETVAIAGREQRLATARRETAEQLALGQWEGRGAAIEQREAWIARVVAQGQAPTERGGNADADRALLTKLACEALRQLPGNECVISLAAHDLARIDARWGASLAAATGKTSVRIAESPAPIGGGCIAVSGDLAFDNSLDERSRRLESRWRSALSALYAVQSPTEAPRTEWR